MVKFLEASILNKKWTEKNLSIPKIIYDFSCHFGLCEASFIDSSIAFSVNPAVSEVCVAQQKSLDVIYK